MTMHKGLLNCSARQRPVCHLDSARIKDAGYDNPISGDQVILEGSRYELISLDLDKDAWVSELASGRGDLACPPPRFNFGDNV